MTQDIRKELEYLLSGGVCFSEDAHTRLKELCAASTQLHNKLHVLSRRFARALELSRRLPVSGPIWPMVLVLVGSGFLSGFASAWLIGVLT